MTHTEIQKRDNAKDKNVVDIVLVFNDQTPERVFPLLKISKWDQMRICEVEAAFNKAVRDLSLILVHSDIDNSDLVTMGCATVETFGEDTEKNIRALVLNKAQIKFA